MGVFMLIHPHSPPDFLEMKPLGGESFLWALELMGLERGRMNEVWIVAGRGHRGSQDS